MYRSSLFLTVALVGTTIASVQPVAAKSAAEVESIARAVSVDIKLQQKGSVGSGVIINRVASPQGDLYTLVTNRHVICGRNICDKIPANEVYSLGLRDGQRYKVQKKAVKFLGDDLDLAVIQFRSKRQYAVAKIATIGNLKINDDVYATGFPSELTGFGIGTGKTIAVVNKRLVGDSGGYTIVYNAGTLPGMSGGGVFDSNGQIVAIHGQGDRYRENTIPEGKLRVDTKMGLNRGIPTLMLVKSLAKLGINVGESSSANIRATRQQSPINADEYFISGVNKLIEPGDNVLAGKRIALQNFSKAIQLNPRYEYAYFMRAIIYQQIQEYQRSLADYNQTVLINPKLYGAYYNRAILKCNWLNDCRGALADYNQAIAINPKYDEAYNARANLKIEKLNDVPGALADYNQAIAINLKYAEAYNNRAVLKNDELNDLQGALADYNQAISINPKYDEAYKNRAVLKNDKLNDVQGALVDYNQAILINPKYAEAYNNRGVLKYNKLNDFQGALADYNQAIAINPKYADAYNNRAVLKNDNLKDVQGALADYNQAILINPKYAEAYNNRGILKNENLNDAQGSLADYNQAIVIKPKYGEAYNNRGVLKYNKLNDFQGALADYNQAIAINPTFSLAYNNRAILKRDKLKDRAGAIQDFRQAAKLFRKQGNTSGLKLAIEALQQLGATE
jgi:tetratricopeptide (TPR) repeat protein/S1-C subfamily serine protease